MGARGMQILREQLFNVGVGNQRHVHTEGWSFNTWGV